MLESRGGLVRTKADNPPYQIATVVERCLFDVMSGTFLCPFIFCDKQGNAKDSALGIKKKVTRYALEKIPDKVADTLVRKVFTYTKLVMITIQDNVQSVIRQ